ncbi:MAG: leucine--tRNA ligase [Nanoarchaeota archaeon]
MAETKRGFKNIEQKWQKKWEEKGIFHAKEGKKRKFYVLEMYPYPSGSGLHMGHAFNYTVGDIFARMKRMQGFNVLYPMGYDSFGLPAENAAIKKGIHPKKYTEKAIANFIKQQKNLGLSYDWSRMIATHKPEYYRWNQFFFLKFLEKGLVYRKKAPVNWCPKCCTVLANEQVHQGRCWRHPDTEVEVKHLEQWFIKTTKYSEELLRDIEKINWPARIKIMQENWIGRSEGTEIDFEIPWNKETNFVLLHGHTGRPNTNFFPWLKKELENRGYKVSVTKLPEPDSSNIDKKVDYVLKNENINEDTIILGHSLGGAVALKVLEKLNKPIKKLVLAAGGMRKEWNYNKIKRNAKEIIYLRDVGDTVIPKNAGEIARNFLDAKVIDFKAEEIHICGLKEPLVLENCLNKWPIFTTRPDTIFGATFMVVSAQHPRLFEIVKDKERKQVGDFLKKIKSVSEKDAETLEKTGVFTGSYAINPINGEKIPIYAGNFVLADYGSGMVMAVPAHDQRDFEFAKKYKLPIKLVIRPKDKVLNDKNLNEAYIGNGVLINSGNFNGLNSDEAKNRITKFLENKKSGKEAVQYKFRDWLVSRQRYWGTPIPVVYCNSCGIVPVPEKDLPVKLPEKVKFGKGNPLETEKKFINVKCPNCGNKGRRETDTMDTFFDSSWYYLRYCDSKNNKKPFDLKKAGYWMPVDQYIGGSEHATMHLIYARFFTKALRDLGFFGNLKINEPFLKLFNQGMLHGKDGFVMSKSRGNDVLPEEISEKYGIDTARLFLVSIASTDKDIQWSDEGIEGSMRFIDKVMDYFDRAKFGKTDRKTESKLNQTIKEVTENIESFQYNLAVIKIRELFSYLENGADRKTAETFLKLISPFCPHIAEELWHKLGNKTFISLEKWPEAEEKKINPEFEKEEKIIDDAINDVNNVVNIVKNRGKSVAKLYLYVLPNELKIYFDNLDAIKKRTNLDAKIYSVADKGKYDPENKSRKVKPGKPGIYLE